jgi:hypothetical protein
MLLYVFAAIALLGIVFLLWALAHLIFEARRQRGAQAQAVENFRPRRRM